MGYWLGVDLGTTFVAAATSRSGRVEKFRLGDRSDVAPSVVMIRQDGAVLTGAAAERRATIEPERVAREFKRKLGDPVPMIVGGSPLPIPALLAHLLRAVVAKVAATEGAPPDGVVLTHPASWNTYQREIFAQVPQLAEVPRVRMITEPEAAAAQYAAQERLAVGQTVAVYDLGGGTFDATVLRRSATGFDILGTPQGIQGLGGIDFDQAVFAHVRESLGGDAFASADRASLYRLRQECVHAKEALSVDTDASIPVLLPGAHTHIRLTRGEFEDMIRPVLADTLTALRGALRSAEVEPEELAAVLLVGGSSKIPLVAKMVSAEFKAPIAVDTDPEFAVALGAAVLAGRGEGGAGAGAGPAGAGAQGAGGAGHGAGLAAAGAAGAVVAGAVAGAAGHPGGTGYAGSGRSGQADGGAGHQPGPAGPQAGGPAGRPGGPGYPGGPAAGRQGAPSAQQGGGALGLAGTPRPGPGGPAGAPSRGTEGSDPGHRPGPGSDPGYRPSPGQGGPGGYGPGAPNGHGAPGSGPSGGDSEHTRMFAPQNPGEAGPRFGAGDLPPQLSGTGRPRRWLRPVLITGVAAVVVAGLVVGGIQYFGRTTTTGGGETPPTSATVAPAAFGQQLANIPIGRSPGRIAITKDGAHAYTTNNGSNDVSVVDTASDSVTATVPVGQGPVLVAIAPNDARAYVTSIEAGTLSVIDVARNTVAATVPVGKSPVGIAVAPDGSTVYVANRDSNSLSVVETAGNTVTGTIRVPGGPFAIALSADGTEAYVTGSEKGTLSVVDLQRRAVTGTVDVGANPGCVKIDKDGTTAYVTSYDTATLKVVDVKDPARPAVARSVPVGKQPAYVALSPDSTRAYVVNQSDGTISVVDTASDAVTTTFPVGVKAPNGMAVTPDGKRGYVVSSDGNSVAVLSLEEE